MSGVARATYDAAQKQGGFLQIPAGWWAASKSS